MKVNNEWTFIPIICIDGIIILMSQCVPAYYRIILAKNACNYNAMRFIITDINVVLFRYIFNVD